jgi:hypothetical protein
MAAIPGATVTVSPEAPCRGRAGAPGSSPRRHASPCAWQCWRSSPEGRAHPARNIMPGGMRVGRARQPRPPCARARTRTRKQGRKLYPHPPCRIRACDSSKCRSRWWRSDQPIWTVSAGTRHEPASAQNGGYRAPCLGSAATVRDASRGSREPPWRVSRRQRQHGGDAQRTGMPATGARRECGQALMAGERVTPG